MATNGAAFPDSSEDGKPLAKAGMLAGLRVFDLSIVTAGAGCTQILADHGAEVFKIETCGRPDLFRNWTSHNAGGGDLYSPPFRTVNRNKKSVSIDLKHPDGLHVARRLVAECDVVVENFRQGVMQRLGLSFKHLVDIRPDIVLVSIASQGTSGPNVDYGSFGSTLDALGGTMSVTGYDKETPLWSSNKVNYPDQTAALLGPALILFGVMSARATGRARWIGVSQRELVTDLLSEQVLARSLGGTDPVPMANNADRQRGWAVRCSGTDEWLAVSVDNDDERKALCRVVGRADLACGPDDDVREALARWSSDHTKFDAMRALQSVGVPAAAVTKGYELHGDAYYGLIDYFKSVELPGGGSELQRGWVVRFDDDEVGGAIRRRAPHVGEHTVEVATELLHMSAAEVEGLLASGALYQLAE